MYNIITWYLYTLQVVQHQKSTFHPSSYIRPPVPILPSPHPIPLWEPPICCLYLRVCFCLVDSFPSTFQLLVIPYEDRHTRERFSSTSNRPRIGISCSWSTYQGPLIWFQPQYVFTEHLLCSRHWGNITGQATFTIACWEPTVWWGWQTCTREHTNNSRSLQELGKKHTERMRWRGKICPQKHHLGQVSRRRTVILVKSRDLGDRRGRGPADTVTWGIVLSPTRACPVW